MTTTVERLIAQVRSLSPGEKKELVRMLIAENIIDIDDDFTDEERLEIELASKEVAQGQWVDFDEHRKDLEEFVVTQQGI
ncbi:MAG TPA: hypothetical protein VN426_02175 [Syntrophomonadaceae bacterium]|nr:hypothetical protein [Syntrophomonadaceae bacterium]